MSDASRFLAGAASANSFSLYDRTSISPDELLAATQEVKRRWPTARLHKNDVTKNLTIYADVVMVGELDLLDASVVDFAEYD